MKDVGVTTPKKTNPKTIGDIILPNVIPNNIHNLVIGFKIFGTNNDTNNNDIDKHIIHKLILL